MKMRDVQIKNPEFIKLLDIECKYKTTYPPFDYKKPPNLYDDLITSCVNKDMSFKKWVNEWKVRSRLNNSNNEKQLQLMRKVNPNVIPRNHKVEEALSAAEHNNFDVMNKLLLLYLHMSYQINLQQSYLLHKSYY